MQDLQTRNERLFLVTILIMNTATNRQKLENAVFQTAAIAQKYNCALKRLDFQQEEGLMSSLPIGINQVEIERGLTTSSTAVFVPFTTQELFQGGEALYYGLNALSNNMIMVDRKQLKNPNGLILGTPGSGRRAIVRDLIENGIEGKSLVLVAESEAADPADARLAALPNTTVRSWAWKDSALPPVDLPADATVFLLADSQVSPIDQLEALKPWLTAHGAELARIF